MFAEDFVNAGDMVTIQCSVAKGDLPIQIIWTLNDLPLDPTDSMITATMFNSRTGMLTVETASGRHAGKYACHASNRAGSAQRFANLAVNGIKSHLFRYQPQYICSF